MPTSFKPVVRTGSDPKWYDNGLRFATHAEAFAWAEDLACRWTRVSDYGVEDSHEAVNHAVVDGRTVALKTDHVPALTPQEA